MRGRQVLGDHVLARALAGAQRVRHVCVHLTGAVSRIEPRHVLERFRDPRDNGLDCGHVSFRNIVVIQSESDQISRRSSVNAGRTASPRSPTGSATRSTLWPGRQTNAWRSKGSISQPRRAPFARYSLISAFRRLDSPPAGVITITSPSEVRSMRTLGLAWQKSKKSSAEGATRAGNRTMSGENPGITGTAPQV